MQCETRLQSTIVARLRSRAKEIATEEREREREMQKQTDRERKHLFTSESNITSLIIDLIIMKIIDN